MGQAPRNCVKGNSKIKQTLVVSRQDLQMSGFNLHSTAGEAYDFTASILWTSYPGNNYIQFSTAKPSLTCTVHIFGQAMLGMSLTVSGADYRITNEVHESDYATNAYQLKLSNITGPIRITVATTYSAVLLISCDITS